MRQPYRISTVVLLALALVGGARAQDAGSAYPLFTDDTPLELRFTAPFRQVFRDDEDRPEYDTLIEWTDVDGRERSETIEVRIRGNSRIEFCRYPPLSLDFAPRADMRGTVFEGQNRLKLVVLCGDTSYYEDYLVTEYLIYRMLNRLTPRSFRVRWAEIEYVDTSGRRERVRTAPGFLIEADWEVAERLGMALVEEELLPIETFDVPHSALLASFQFLIGNIDWSLIEGPEGEPCCHNGKVVTLPDDGPHFLLSYDFDTSGLVNAEYAAPNEALRMRSVRQRRYRGYCAFDPGVDAAVDTLLRQREQLLAVFDSDLLSERRRRDAVAYLESGFEVFGDQETRRDQLHDECLD